MTSRERLRTVLAGGIPDHVPVAPDTSNMIPARLTGKPFWDLYLYQNPPIWKAYIDCVRYFGFDSLMDGYAPVEFSDMTPPAEGREVIVFRNEERIVTQWLREAGGKRFWSEKATVYYIADPPSHGIDPLSIRLPREPAGFCEIGDVFPWPEGAELLSLVKKELGDRGLVGVRCGTSALLHTEQDIYDYYDDPEVFQRRRDAQLSFFECKLRRLLSLSDRPDFICVGASGSLVYQTPDIFRDLGLPVVKKITALCKEAGMPAHLHSCGPEALLVKICAEETDLTVIDPLEIPPMGDCNLAELKKLYGNKLVLKGNLHTTDVMLNGTPDDVREAAKRAIDDAAAGGKFILSTGDQCGRDTPDENIFAMIDVAKTYGKY